MLTAYRFRPSLLVTAVVAVLLPALAGLGFWQLERAAEKTAIRDRYIARGDMAPVQVGDRELSAAAMDFRRARARGRYQPDWTIFLDNRVLDGTPGYEVLTPLRVEDTDRFLLVNRGWVPWGETPRELPAIDTPEGVVALSGRLRAPPDDYFTLEDEAQINELRARWQNLDLSRYARLTGLDISPLVLQLDPANRSGGGFVRRWREYRDDWIARHKGYAVQWFALAFTLAVLYVALNLKKRTPDHD